MTSKQVKDAAALVGALAGIVCGTDKIKTVIQKWKVEYKERKDNKEKKDD